MSTEPCPSIQALDLQDKETIVNLLMDVQVGNVSCRRAATEIRKQTNYKNDKSRSNDMTPVEIGTTVHKMVEAILEKQEAKVVTAGAILTGSRAYGTPTPASDIDLVIRMNPLDIPKLAELADERMLGYELKDGASLRFGKLNLICVCSDKEYFDWMEGTSELILKKPVTRAHASEVFKHLEGRKRDEH